MEERTWLHVAYALGRVYEYHALWFQVLATFGFATYLVWDTAYALQVYSGLFIAINLYALLNACLEAKLLAPAADDVQRGALATRIAGRYACFVYQCMYLSWAFDANEVLPRSPVRSLGRTNAFWWWQYVWLSLIPMCIYVTEASLQLWPRALTSIYESVRTVTFRGRCWQYSSSFHELCGKERPRAARYRPNLPTVLAHLSSMEAGLWLSVFSATHGRALDPDRRRLPELPPDFRKRSEDGVAT